MEKLQTKFTTVVPHVMQMGKEHSSTLKREKEAFVLHRIHSGENQTLFIECRQENLQKLDS